VNGGSQALNDAVHAHCRIFPMRPKANLRFDTKQQATRLPSSQHSG